MTGNVWSMEQVRQARGLHATLLVGLEVAEQPGVEDVVRSKLAKRLADMGHPLGLEIDPRDVELSRRNDLPHLHEASILGRWNPSVTGAVLVGGPRDGERWALQRVGDPLRVAVLEQTPWLDTSDVSAESTVDIRTVEYGLIGWHEEERLWAYGVRGRS
jgi:hypothetical protein